MKYLIGLLLLASTLNAQELPAALKPIAKVLSDQTVMVARVDLSSVDIPAVLDKLEGVFPEDVVAERALSLRFVQSQWAKFVGADLYVVASMDSLTEPPMIAFELALPPKEREGRDMAMADLWQRVLEYPDLKYRRFDDLLVLGTKEQLDRVAKNKTAPNPLLVEGMVAAAAEGGPLQAAVSMTADTRRIFEESSPTLPPDLGKGSIQLLTRGIRHVRLSVGKTPAIPVRLTVECEAEADAAGVLPIWATLLKRAIDDLSADTDETVKVFAARLKTLLEPKVTGKRLVVALDGGKTFEEFAAMYAKTPDRGDRLRSMNNLKQLMLAVYNYEDAYGYLPRDIRSKDGKPLLSWRVQILPYVEQDALYLQFKLDEPWDSETNKKLLSKMPAFLRSPKQAKTLTDKTTYLAPLGDGLAWDVPKDRRDGLKIPDFTDGTSKTILLVEADDEVAVEWTRPADLKIDPKQPEKGLKGHFRTVMLVGIADGSVRTFAAADWKGEAFYAWFTRGGGEVLSEKNGAAKPVLKK